MPSKVTRRRFLESTGSAALLTAGTAVAADAAAAKAAAGPIKILGICCSPRKGKTTAAALAICLEAVKAADPRIEVELIELAGLKIPGEVAAGVALQPGERDDFPALTPKLSDPAVAGIILGTPVYFGNMSYLCKALLDRCIVFHKEKQFANKVGGVLAVGGGRNCGLELTIRSVQVALMSQQMIVVGDAPPTGHWGGTVWGGNPAVGSGPTPDIARDAEGIATVKNLGRRVAEIAMRLRASQGRSATA
ncbi:MAG: flavodoxin family protein [Thermoguttaceae bacterium]|jgi:multimeric flavodoxin WrbA